MENLQQIKNLEKDNTRSSTSTKLNNKSSQFRK